ncbi:hypothetical protein DL93DRAFT_806480 [Clavulina sp. PMI_390]|nr:hypothetical protein DL93DRAFT_806480 [Clavulina sp. PMI_390]
MCLSRSFIAMNLVCRRARSIALASPCCWRYVLLIIEDGELVNPADAVADYLARSGTTHFNLFIFITDTMKYLDVDNDEEEDDEALYQTLSDNQIWRLLGGHIHRCQHITICSPRLQSFAPGFQSLRISNILRSGGWSFPSLRHVIITDHGCTQVQPIIIEEPFWAHSDSRVDSLEIVSFGDLKVTMITPTALNGVKRLKIGNALDPSSAAAITQNLTLLKHLDWDLSSSRDIAEGSISLAFPNLLSLRLPSKVAHPGDFALVAPECEELYLHELDDLKTSHDTEVCPAHWDALTLPKLRRLSLKRPYPEWGQRDPILPHILDFLDRHPTIEEVVVLPPSQPSYFTRHKFFRYLSGRTGHPRADSIQTGSVGVHKLMNRFPPFVPYGFRLMPRSSSR